jgi:hypothetical protein
VTDEGIKTKLPLGPTATLNVVALATIGQKATTGTIMATNTAKRLEQVFITSMI